MCDLKIPQSGWLKAFWPISQEQHFSKQQICTGTQELNFYYRTNSGEINDQIFLWIKKKNPISGPKVRDIEYDVGLTKHFWLTVSMQKISWIHKLILYIHHILGSHELNGHTHFWPCSPKNHWNNFQFCWICTSMQNISLFHSFLILLISEFFDQSGYTHFWPCPPKIYSINF